MGKHAASLIGRKSTAHPGTSIAELSRRPESTRAGAGHVPIGTSSRGSGTTTHYAHPDEIHVEELPHLAAAFHEKAKAGDVDAEHHRDRALSSMAKRGIAPKGRAAGELRTEMNKLAARDTGWYGARTDSAPKQERATQTGPRGGSFVVTATGRKVYLR